MIGCSEFIVGVLLLLILNKVPSLSLAANQLTLSLINY